VTLCRKAVRFACLIVLFAATVTVAASGSEVQLRVLGWGDLPPYELAFEEFARNKGVPTDLVNVEPFLLEETDVFDGLRSEMADIILFPNKQILGDQARMTNLLLPINTGKLQNYHLLHETLRKNPSYRSMDEKNGLKYGIPYRADIQTLLYNTGKMRKAPDSWMTLWSPRHAGKISPFGYQTEWNVGATLLAMGYKPETAYDMEAQVVDWDGVKKKLAELVQNSYAFWEWPPSDKIIEECDMIYGFGLLLRYLNKRESNWRVAIPREGVQLWIDDFCIAKGVKNFPGRLKAAYLFIDFMLTDEMQMRVYLDQYYVPVSTTAIKVLAQDYAEVRLTESFYRDNTTMLMSNMDIRTRNHYLNFWKKALEESGKK